MKLRYNDFIEDETVDMNSDEFSICLTDSICADVLDMPLRDEINKFITKKKL